MREFFCTFMSEILIIFFIQIIQIHDAINNIGKAKYRSKQQGKSVLVYKTMRSIQYFRLSAPVYSIAAFNGHPNALIFQ